jgi:hypothetical protein
VWTPGLIHFIAGSLIPRNIDPSEDLQYFSWWGYAFVAAAYSALVFSGELSKDGPLIFSRRNARVLSQILLIHVAFLIILLCFLRISSYIVPSLPYWMTDTFRARRTRVSIADIIFFLAAMVMLFIERRKLYVESAPSASDSEGESGRSSTIESE